MSTRRKSNKGIAIFWLMVAAILILILLGVYLVLLAGDSTPEETIGLTIALIVSVLMVLLFVMASGFKYLGLADANQALGLPEGSVRAMISLFLIMIFISLSLYLYRTVYYPPSYRLDNLKLAEVEELGNKVVNRVYDPDTDTYDVRISMDTNPEGVEIAKDLINSIGILVTSLSSFYFGARAVQVAKGEKIEDEVIIRSVEPKEDVKGKDVKLTISGEGFLLTKSVVLVSKENKEIQANEVLSNNTKVFATFNSDSLKDAKVDLYGIKIITEDGIEETLDGVFTLKEASSPKTKQPTTKKTVKRQSNIRPV